MKKRAGNIFCGVLIIAATILWMLSKLGYIGDAVTGHIIVSTLWIAWLIKGCIERKSFSIFMSLAFLAIVWNKELGIEAITPWPVIGAAIFLTIGVSFIFKDSKRKNWQHKYYNKYDNNYQKKFNENNNNFENDNNTTDERNTEYGTSQPHESHVDGEHVYHMNRFSGAEKYIDSQNLKSVEIINKAGGMEVYLDNAKAAGDKVYMRIECIAGGMEIYIPKNWKVQNNIDCFVGVVEEPADIDMAVNDVTLVISGIVRAAGVEIIRV